MKVVKVLDYGCFVEFPNGTQALLHISELSHERVSFSLFMKTQKCRVGFWRLSKNVVAVMFFVSL